MVTNVIPFFGPFLGAIPSALILLMVNPMSSLWFIVFIIVLQQFDGNYLGPRILGDSTGLPPIWVLVSIIVGGGMFGVMGMIAGVPTIAVLHTLVHELVEKRLKAGGYDSDAQYLGSFADECPDAPPNASGNNQIDVPPNALTDDADAR
jgi:predicted PurR-regulated permease PerM